MSKDGGLASAFPLSSKWFVPLSRKNVVYVGFAVLAILIGWFGPRYLNLMAIGENWTYDLRAALLEPPIQHDDRFIIVTITEDTLAALPYRSPVDRALLTRTIQALADKGVKAVALDILFDQPTELEKDEALRQMLVNGPVPVVVGWTDARTGLTDEQVAFQSEYLDGALVGYSNMLRDITDGTVRKTFPGRTGPDGREIPAFADAIVSAAGGTPVGREDYLRYIGKPDADPPPFNTYQIQTVALLPDVWLKDKIVIVGADLPLDDRHRTPYAAVFGVTEGSFPGLYLQAMIASQIMDGQTYQDLPDWAQWGLLLITVMIGGFLIFLNLGTGMRFCIAVALCALFGTGAVLLFEKQHLVVPIVGPFFCFATFLGIGFAHRVMVVGAEARYIEAAFKRLVSHNVVAEIKKNPEFFSLGGERRVMTFIFTDLAGFTSFIEKTDPALAIGVLNEYINGMLKLGFKHDATLDKIVGDATVFFFNAPMDQPDHQERAVRLALDMLDFTRDFQKRMQSEGVNVKHTRIGVNTGEVTVGNFGGEWGFDYTAQGNAINSAARLESLNDWLGTRVLVSGNTLAGVSGVSAREVGQFVLKGQTEPLKVYNLYDPNGSFAKVVPHFEQGYNALDTDLEEAARHFEDALRLNPKDGPSKFYLGRIQDGTYGKIVKMTAK